MKGRFKKVIEEAELKDFFRLKKIGMACFEKSIRQPGENYIAALLFRLYFSKRRFCARIKQGTKVFVLREKEVVVGFYELESSGLLSSLYVDPDVQNNGYGSSLLLHALELAKQMKLPKMRLDSSKKAVSFYETRGFKKVGDSRFVFGVCMVPMEKQLNKT